MTKIPCFVILVPARDFSLCRDLEFNQEIFEVSQNNWMAVATLFIFCPPGPEDLTNFSFNRFSGTAKVPKTWTFSFAIFYEA